jgi:hypothetical protein
VASYGQPVSTHGSQIDYWLAGEAGAHWHDKTCARCSTDEWRRCLAVGPRHYQDFSEQLLLLPGMGILHSYPEHYQWTASPNASRDVLPSWHCSSMSGQPVDETALIINTQAAVHKTNAEWLSMLVRIVAQVEPLPNTRCEPAFTVQY